MIGSQVVDLIKDQLPDLPNEQAQALVEAVNEAIPAIRDAIAEEVADPYNQGYVTGLIIWEILEWLVIGLIAALTAGAGAAAAAPKLALSAARWTKRGIKIGQDMIARLRQLVSDLADQMILKGAASRATFNAKAVGDELLESALNKGSKNAADAAKHTGETLSTITGKNVHKSIADARRASGDFELVQSAINDKNGNPILISKRVNLKTGQPQAGTKLQEVIPDAVSFRAKLIVDDKPLGRPIAKDRQEIIRFIEAYRRREGHLPDMIAIQRYDPISGQPVLTELYSPSDFLP